jgi:hypothetical protein
MGAIYRAKQKKSPASGRASSRRERLRVADQAASCSRSVLPRPPSMAIFRGFMASGISRYEVDVEQAVLEARRRHLDVLGELELALEVARRDAAVQEVAVVAVLLLRPLITSVFCSLVISRSSSVKPATAMVMR